MAGPGADSGSGGARAQGAPASDAEARRHASVTATRRGRRRLLLLGVAALGLTALATSCSPLYVLRAGWEEARILTARRPIEDVIVDPDTDDRHARQAHLRAPGAHLRHRRAGTRRRRLLHHLHPPRPRHPGDGAVRGRAGPPGGEDLVVSGGGPGSLPGILRPGRRPRRTAQAGRGGIRHLAAPHLRLQHPGVVRGPADVDGAAPGRDRCGADHPSRGLARPPLGAGKRPLQRELRNLRGRCRRGPRSSAPPRARSRPCGARARASGGAMR